MGNPLSNAVGANGNIRNFQVVVGGINLMLLPLTWIAFKFFGEKIPEWAFVIQIILCIVAQVARILLVKPLINLSIWAYIKQVVTPCARVTIIASIVPILLAMHLSDGFLSLVFVSLISVISVIVSIYYLGLEKSEKEFVLSKLKKHDRNKE